MNVPENKTIFMEKNGSVILFTRERDGKQAEYDFKDKGCYIINKDKRKKVKSLERFFVHSRIQNLKSDNKSYQKFLNFIASKSTRYRNIQRFIEQLDKYADIEKLFVYEGLNVVLNQHSNPHIQSIDNYPKFFLKFLVKYNIPLDKKCLSILREGNLMELMAKSLQNEKLGNLLLESKENWTSYHFSRFLEAIKRYNLKPIRAFEYINYLMNYEGLSQYEACHSYIDYLSMATELKKKIEKYPQNLLTIEKIYSTLYNERKKIYDNKRFKKAVEKYIHLQYSDKEYSIIAPKDTDDLIEEGRELNHCVGSYCNRIMDEKTIILFLRKNDDINKRLVTIEVNDNRIIQISAACNRRPNKEELNFLKKYARKKDLDIKDVYL